MDIKIQQFIQNRLQKNKDFMDVYGNQLNNLKGDQSPEVYVLMCGDSRCVEQVFSGESLKLGDVFGGSGTLGNIVTQEVLATIAYNVDHLKTKYFVVCGHTGCGAVNASMGDYSKERPVLKQVLNSLKVSYEGLEKHPHLQSEDESLHNVFRNVQAQVLKIIDEFNVEIEAEAFVVLGAVYDNQGMLGPIGKVYFTSVNGQYCFID